MARILRHVLCSSCRSEIRVSDLREFRSAPWGSVATLSRRHLPHPPIIGSVYYCPVHGSAFVPHWVPGRSLVEMPASESAVEVEA